MNMHEITYQMTHVQIPSRMICLARMRVGPYFQNGSQVRRRRRRHVLCFRSLYISCGTFDTIACNHKTTKTANLCFYIRLDV